MRNKSLRLLVAAAALACARPPAAPPAPTPADLVKAANALDAAFVEAFNRGDAEALAALYSAGTSVVSFPPDAFALRGHEAILEGNRKSFAASPGAKIELTEHNQIPGGDLVVGWGTFKVTIPGPDGKTAEFEGRFTDVKAERGGKWVYLVDHASFPLPPPATAAAPQSAPSP